MAGKIIADTIEASGSQISLNVGNVTVLTASSTGLTLIPTTNVNINVANSNVTFTTANVTGVATFSAGSNTAPSITTSGDTNTGLYFPAADTIGFVEGGVEAMRINSSGNLQTLGTISVGNATPSTSGAGITFPATQSASTNANTLDDYEEGTWTPTITAYAGSVTAYTSQGSYVKIGRIVFATVYAVVSNAGTASGAYVISNLPFSLATSAEVYGYGVNLLTNVGLAAYGSGSTSLYCFTAAGAFPGGSGTYVTLNFNYSV